MRHERLRRGAETGIESIYLGAADVSIGSIERSGEKRTGWELCSIVDHSRIGAIRSNGFIMVVSARPSDCTTLCRLSRYRPCRTCRLRNYSLAAMLSISDTNWRCTAWLFTEA